MHEALRDSLLVYEDTGSKRTDKTGFAVLLVLVKQVKQVNRDTGSKRTDKTGFAVLLVLVKQVNRDTGSKRTDKMGFAPVLQLTSLASFRQSQRQRLRRAGCLSVFVLWY